MLSGQFTPLTANLVPRPKFIVEDDPTATDGHYQCDKFITQTTTTATTISTYTTTTKTTESITPTSVFYTKNAQNSVQQTSGARTPPNTDSPRAISIPGIIGSTVGTGSLFGAVPTTSSSAATAAEGGDSGGASNQNTPDQQQQQPQQQPQPHPANCSAAEASGRSAALERAYVHDVYENCEEPAGPIRPRVAQFLAGLDPGSIVCDVGCGNGRYLTSCNPLICTIGVDRCYRLTKIAHEKGGEVALCDNLELPFRDESFDAVLSLAVVHHFATTERRVGAIRELARILRIGGRVIITVWALEQRHRRFESQDVLIPWQPPKNRNQTNSDEEDDDEYLPPYHAYTEDSTNSSRSAGDGDSSSLSSSSPGESCYSFVRRAIQKLAGGRKHPWFLDSWNSKDTKNDSSLDYEDAKDLPIELRRLEDFEDFPEPPLSAGLKSRSLGSILNPPPRQIVRSRSSVPSLGAQITESKPPPSSSSQISSHTTHVTTSPASLGCYHNAASGHTTAASSSLVHQDLSGNVGTSIVTSNTGPSITGTPSKSTILGMTSSAYSSGNGTPINSSGGSMNSIGGSGRRPKLVKQKQSLCDDEYQLPDNPFQMTGNNNYSNSISMTSSKNQSIYNSNSSCNNVNYNNSSSPRPSDSKIFLRKQSSLNEELMAESRLREKERIRKRIQKQMSLNETFLCRSLFSKRLQIIREGFTTKLKTSTGSLERVTKNGFVKIMQNFKNSQFSSSYSNKDNINETYGHNHYHHQYHVNHQTANGKPSASQTGISGNCVQTAVSNNVNNNNNNSINNSNNNNSNNGNEDQKPRRHSRESGSDSSKDSSLQSDTSIESEDSFASVIYIPRPEQNKQQCCNSNNCITNNNNNGSTKNHSNNNVNCVSNNNSHKIPSVPTSPLTMPCPPTPAHSPAAAPTNLSALTTSSLIIQNTATSPKTLNSSSSPNSNLQGNSNIKVLTNRFTFDDDHIQQQHQQQEKQQQQTKQQQQHHQKPQIKQDVEHHRQMNLANVVKSLGKSVVHSISSSSPKQTQKITRQIIKELPQIPKFRRQQSLQQQQTKAIFPIVRRASAAPAMPKLLSLELFNPETDDLDSDSSEPSSPDSIDSVISALKPCEDTDTLISVDKPKSIVDTTNKIVSKLHKNEEEHKTILGNIQKLQSTTIQNSAQSVTKVVSNVNSTIDKRTIVVSGSGNLLNKDKHKSCDNEDRKLSDNLSLNRDISELNIPSQESSVISGVISSPSQQNLADFAEQLNVQLLKELEENKAKRKYYRNDSFDNEEDCQNKYSLNKCEGDTPADDCNNKHRGDDLLLNKLAEDINDCRDLREELRERRLRLANLSSSSSRRSVESPTNASLSCNMPLLTSSRSPSSASSSPLNIGFTGTTSSLPALSRGNSLGDSNNSGKEDHSSANHSYNYLNDYQNHRQNHYSVIPDTTYLMQDDGNSSSIDFDDNYHDSDDNDIEHDIILEEDEEDDDEDIPNSVEYFNPTKSKKATNISNDNLNHTLNNNIHTDHCHTDSVNSTNHNNNSNKNNKEHINLDSDNNYNLSSHFQTPQPATTAPPPLPFDLRHSTESWGHSNSTTSLDSPSQGGGATTHHRYYHVFREGELDALINHHVTSLHIVSSYYERASWCVVAEKVQVWTI